MNQGYENFKKYIDIKKSMENLSKECLSLKRYSLQFLLIANTWWVGLLIAWSLIGYFLFIDSGLLKLMENEGISTAPFLFSGVGIFLVLLVKISFRIFDILNIENNKLLLLKKSKELRILKNKKRAFERGMDVKTILEIKAYFLEGNNKHNAYEEQSLNDILIGDQIVNILSEKETVEIKNY